MSDVSDYTDLAQKEANWVLRDTVSRLKTEASAGSGLAAMRSKANVDEIEQRQTELKRQLRELEDTYSQPFRL